MTINDAGTLQITKESMYLLKNISIFNSRGLQLSTNWCTSVEYPCLLVKEQFNTSECRNLSDITMICPIYQNFKSIKEDGSVKYVEIKGYLIIFIESKFIF